MEIDEIYNMDCLEGMRKMESESVDLTVTSPPYGRAIAAWVKKCHDEAQKPDTLVVMLIPARTDTSYFHDYIYHQAEIRFIRGRLHFNDAPQGAPFPSMVVVFGQR